MHRWEHLAACRAHPDVTVDEFYADLPRVATLRVCDVCEVRSQCAAAGRDEEFGVWGGMPSRFTRRLLAKRLGMPASRVTPARARELLALREQG